MGTSDFNSCFARLLSLEFEKRCIVPWVDKKSINAKGVEPLTDEVKKALERADTIVICLSSGDLKRCSEYEDDFLAFELQTAIDLSDGGKPIVKPKRIPCLERQSYQVWIAYTKERLEFRRYVIDFGVPDDIFEAILDGICAKQGK